ncbi:hypothetical protein [Amycolatopsis sp. NPDC059020]|uniref:hypothetical protein n=1 Tax=unclassified Amycolatopsis TaxID=2618356 RepID=UPI00366A9E81
MTSINDIEDRPRVVDGVVLGNRPADHTTRPTGPAAEWREEITRCRTRVRELDALAARRGRQVARAFWLLAAFLVAALVAHQPWAWVGLGAAALHLVHRVRDVIRTTHDRDRASETLNSRIRHGY